MTVQEYKVLENRLRRAAERQGFRLEKSRRRDPRAIDYGTYALVEGPPPAPGGENWRSRQLVAVALDLEDLARFLFEKINVHIDHSPEGSMTIGDNGEPILHYSSFCSTGAKDKRGRPIPDGWVLHYLDDNEGVDQWIVGGELGSGHRRG